MDNEFLDQLEASGTETEQALVAQIRRLTKEAEELREFAKMEADSNRIMAAHIGDVHQFIIDREKAKPSLEAGLEELIEEWSDSGFPVYGPVDGTGRHDPNGWMMFDAPRDYFLDELRRVRRGEPKKKSKSRPRRPPRIPHDDD